MTRTYDPAKLPAHLLAAYRQFGGLTQAELDELSVVTPASPFPTVEPTIRVDHMHDAFQAAVRNGVKNPKVHVDGFTFKLAPSTGKNPGAIYVTEDETGFDEYLGKIVGNSFVQVKGCTEEQRQRILAAASDPLNAMLNFGRKFGRCSVCNRKLTDPESIQRAIGPICANNFGF